MRTNPSEQSFTSGLLYDLERMREEDYDQTQIIESIHKRLTKYLRYNEIVMNSRVEAKKRRAKVKA